LPNPLLERPASFERFDVTGDGAQTQAGTGKTTIRRRDRVVHGARVCADFNKP
jgi:hypothetical protein